MTKAGTRVGWTGKRSWNQNLDWQLSGSLMDPLGWLLLRIWQTRSKLQQTSTDSVWNDDRCYPKKNQVEWILCFSRLPFYLPFWKYVNRPDCLHMWWVVLQFSQPLKSIFAEIKEIFGERNSGFFAICLNINVFMVQKGCHLFHLTVFLIKWVMFLLILISRLSRVITASCGGRLFKLWT